MKRRMNLWIVAAAAAAAFAALPALAQAPAPVKPGTTQPAPAIKQAPAAPKTGAMSNAAKTGYGTKICNPACTNGMYCDGDSGTCKN